MSLWTANTGGGGGRGQDWVAQEGPRQQCRGTPGPVGPHLGQGGHRRGCDGGCDGKAFKTAPRAWIAHPGGDNGICGWPRPGWGWGGQALHPGFGLQGPVPPARLHHETWIQTLKRMLALTPSRDPASLTWRARHPNPLLPPLPSPTGTQATLVSTAWWGWREGRLRNPGCGMVPAGVGALGAASRT